MPKITVRVMVEVMPLPSRGETGETWTVSDGESLVSVNGGPNRAAEVAQQIGTLASRIRDAVTARFDTPDEVPTSTTFVPMYPPSNP